MADTGAVTPNAILDGGVKVAKFEWISDASGNAERTITNLPIDGLLLGLITIPDGTAVPTDNYDVTILDVFANNLDILDGNGADRDASNTERVALDIGANGQPHPARIKTSGFTFKVAGAGNAKQGTALLYWK